MRIRLSRRVLFAGAMKPPAPIVARGLDLAALLRQDQAPTSARRPVLRELTERERLDFERLVETVALAAGETDGDDKRRGSLCTVHGDVALAAGETDGDDGVDAEEPVQ